MRAAVYSGKGEIACREIPKPEIGDYEALVQVRAAAICGTDLRIFKNGHHHIKEGTERVLGHELAGEIVALGPKVTRYGIGMRVGMASNVGCGVCRYCRMGMLHLCPEYIAVGITFDGGFAEFFKVDEKPLLQGNMIPFERSSFEEIAIAEPLSCAINALQSVGTKPGEAVLIVGAGPLGALHLQLNRLAGAGPIMMADISEHRLELLKRFDPDVIIDSSKEDLRDAVMKHTGGIGADVIITACPAPEIQQLSVEIAAKLGRINFFGGLPKGKEQVALNTNLIHYNGLVVTGTTGASLAHYEQAIQLIECGRIDAGSVISKRFRIEQVREAFDYALSGRGLKTILEFQG
jgi:threonine dehydrogenase-like Zn-dependent dehydrogenase